MIASFWSWLAGNKWARDLAVFIGMIGGLIIGERIYRMNVESGVKRRMNDKQARERAEAETQIIKTITENSNEYVRAAERVRSHDFAQQLPDQAGARLPSENYRD